MASKFYDGESMSDSVERVVAATREIARLLVTVHPEEDVSGVADEMEAVVEHLRDKVTLKVRQHESLRRTRNPVSGMTSAVSPGFSLRVEGNRATGEVVFNEAFQGPPGVVHGGIVAAAFDELLGRARHLITRSAVTGELKVKYLKPTPINQVITGEAWIVEETGRKMLIRGVLRDGDVVTAEAEGVFIQVDRQSFTEISKEIFDRPPAEKENS